ncbi:MAG: hypothetical protein M1816_006169 [Peltula sp. TS41687]|nr:MAG: hypothetical protein M1816_006169 [Peltula sp. TS41687]
MNHISNVTDVDPTHQSLTGKMTILLNPITSGALYPWLYRLDIPSPKTYVSLFLLFYLLLVRLLRHRREKQMRKKFNYPDRESFKSMTDNDACAIQLDLVELEFPTIFEKALQFALFRTYGIGTVASLLMSTKQLSTSADSPKRYSDTEVLITEFVGNAPTSSRTLDALARMNYIHGYYRKAGKISNDDMLYTLALFALEPAAWISRYEWRELNDMELCAIGTYWKSIGDAMAIDYNDRLPSAPDGWRDGLQWLSEVREWAGDYEKAHMLPNADSRKTADCTVAILLWHVPQRLKQFGTKAVTVLMDDRLRESMLYDPPPATYVYVMKTILTLRRLFLRHLALPRPELLRVRRIASNPNTKTGRYNFQTWTAQPWYVSRRARWSLEGLITRLLPNGVLPGDDGDKYASGGYHIEEVGPRSMLGKGCFQPLDLGLVPEPGFFFLTDFLWMFRPECLDRPVGWTKAWKLSTVGVMANDSMLTMNPNYQGTSNHLSPFFRINKPAPAQNRWAVSATKSAAPQLAAPKLATAMPENGPWDIKPWKRIDESRVKW